MFQKLKKWYIRWKVNLAIAEIKRKKLPYQKGKEEEIKELESVFEEYKNKTIQQLREIYEKYC